LRIAVVGSDLTDRKARRRRQKGAPSTTERRAVDDRKARRRRKCGLDSRGEAYD
jgi:hypothetical protein